MLKDGVKHFTHQAYKHIEEGNLSKHARCNVVDPNYDIGTRSLRLVDTCLSLAQACLKLVDPRIHKRIAHRRSNQRGKLITWAKQH